MPLSKSPLPARPERGGLDVLVAAVFRAEAGKILVIILQLWLVLVTYQEVVFVVFFASFVITVLLFRMALIERH